MTLSPTMRLFLAVAAVLSGVVFASQMWRGFGEDVAKNWVYVYYSDTASEPQVEALKAMMNADVEDWKKKGTALVNRSPMNWRWVLKTRA